MIAALTGFMGSGKSRVGFELARKLGLRHVDLDRAIVQRTGRTIPELFAEGESAFRAVELDTLRSVLSRGRGDSFVLSLGGGTVTIPEALELVLENTVSFYLKSSMEQIRAHVGGNTVSRPLFGNAEALLAARTPLYEKAAFTIDTDGKTPQMIADEIASVLERQVVR